MEVMGLGGDLDVGLGSSGFLAVGFGNRRRCRLRVCSGWANGFYDVGW
jgi:hypothetical protein